MQVVYILAVIIGVPMLIGEGIYGYRVWRDVKLARATNGSYARNRDTFQLFAAIWFSFALSCGMLVLVATVQFGVTSELFRQAMIFGLCGTGVCLGLTAMMVRAAKKFGALALQVQS